MNQSIAVVKYNSGNIQSLSFALERLGIAPIVTDDPGVLESADKVIFPGVGEAGSAMSSLVSSGINEILPKLKQPVLGICLGMQLMCQHSEEGDTKGLSIFQEEVQRFNIDAKVPHMGWNSIEKLRGALFKGVPEKSYVYFVHSYRVGVGSKMAASTTYEHKFSAALERDNFFAVQFHPEKSADTGAKILRNFVEL